MKDYFDITLSYHDCNQCPASHRLGAGSNLEKLRLVNLEFREDIQRVFPGFCFPFYVHLFNDDVMYYFLFLIMQRFVLYGVYEIQRIIFFCILVLIVKMDLSNILRSFRRYFEHCALLKRLWNVFIGHYHDRERKIGKYLHK